MDGWRRRDIFLYLEFSVRSSTSRCFLRGTLAEEGMKVETVGLGRYV